MATKSDNTTGNPWHDDEGKFTSPDAATLGVSVEDFEKYLANGEKLEPEAEEGFEFVDDIDDVFDELFNDEIGDVFDQLIEEGNTLKTHPFSQNAADVMQYAVDFISPDYVNGVMEHYNPNAKWASDRYLGIYNKGTKAERRANTFIQEMIKYRFGQQYASPLTQEEYSSKIFEIQTKGSGQLNAGYDYGFLDKNLSDYADSSYMEEGLSDPEGRDLGCGMIAVFRGIEGVSNNQTMADIKATYFGTNGLHPIISFGGCLCSTHYFSMQYSYSKEYYTSNGSDNRILRGIINAKDINIIDEDEAGSLRNRIAKIAKNYRQQIYDKFFETVQDQHTAERLADDYIEALGNDYGLVNVIAGAQMIFGEKNNGMQCDLYDLSVLELLQ